jgi:nucleotide-binding universal stress UspA family protein
MYKRIVVAVDETDAAMRAVREAIALAQPGGGEVRFVNIGGGARGEAGLAWAARVAQRAGVKGTTARLAVDGGIGETIVQEATRWSADLIVTGRHNRGALERLVLGSVAEGIVRASELPVLIVRQATRPSDGPPPA